MSVMLRSILETADKERKYEIIILNCDISQNSMEKLREMFVEFPNFSLEFSDFTEIAENCKFFVSRHITIEAYFRLWIPFKFPQYKKALYFDGDMVATTDVSQLFDMDISGYLVGAVRDVAAAWYFLPQNLKTDEYRKIYEYMLSMKNPSDYINSGMLVINCEKFRQTYSQNDILDAISSREWQVHDQDVINFLAKDKILHLDYSWNFMLTSWARCLPQNLAQKYLEGGKNPKVIHYKPYNFDWYIPNFEFFWKYATRTPFLDKIVEKVRRLADGVK
jgi:lipopolysaccharide biosynthesis glycosyltransferase